MNLDAGVFHWETPHLDSNGEFRSPLTTGVTMNDLVERAAQTLNICESDLFTVAHLYFQGDYRPSDLNHVRVQYLLTGVLPDFYTKLLTDIVAGKVVLILFAEAKGAA